MNTKFRIWDGEELHKPPHPYLIDSGGTIFREHKTRTEFFPDAAALFYTTLNDRGGTPIYEGDILRGGSLYVVVFYDGGWAISSLEEDAAIRLDQSTVVSGVTVIGNRYENPELLRIAEIRVLTNPS